MADIQDQSHQESENSECPVRQIMVNDKIIREIDTFKIKVIKNRKIPNVPSAKLW